MPVLPDFEGIQYRLAFQWKSLIPIEKRSIQYLEIGAYCGGSAVSVAQTYARHPESKITCIDPWVDYDEYDEYKGEQNTIYENFCKNIKTYEIESKIIAIRGFSHEVLPKLQDNCYDMIYVDGNHEAEYALEDLVLCFRKLKPGGYIIVDDYYFTQPDNVKKAVDAFVSVYSKKIKVLNLDLNNQSFLQKL